MQNTKTNQLAAKYAITIQEATDQLMKLIPMGQAMLLLGAPGLGKTAAAREVARLLDLPYHEVRLQEHDAIDFRGLPVPDMERRVADWLRSTVWSEDKCVMCFDEITLGGDELGSVVLKVIRERQIGGFKLHPETVIIATGNRVEDRAGAHRMSSALRESFGVLEIRADLTQWLEWYRGDEHYNDVVEQYLIANPELIHVFDPSLDENQPCPRNWHKIGQVIRLTMNTSVVAGFIGSDYAHGFVSFVRLRGESNLPSVSDVIAGNKDAPTKLLDMDRWAKSIVEEIVAIDAEDRGGEYAFALKDLLAALPESFLIPSLHTLLNELGRASMRKKPWSTVFSQHVEALTKHYGG